MAAPMPRTRGALLLPGLTLILLALPRGAAASSLVCMAAALSLQAPCTPPLTTPS